MGIFCLRAIGLGAAASFLLFGIVGCQRNGLEIVPVSGRVTVDGQPVPGPGRIVFTPVDPAPGSPTRAATAKFDEEGKYRAQTFEPGDGILPGKYQIGIDCWKSAPNMEGRPVISYVAPKARRAATSGLELVVEPGSRSVEFDIDVPGEK